ncbi:MAG: hypothetical protein AAF433_11835 [Bacteroidota bacterium]
MRHLCLFVLVFVGYSFGLWAQTEPSVSAQDYEAYLGDTTGSIQLISRYRLEGVDLRWGYSSPQAWNAHFREGVTVYRRRITAPATDYAPIAEVQIMSDAELEALAGQGDDPGMLGVIHKMAYQEWEEDAYSGSGPGFMDAVDRLTNRYTYFHFAADRDAAAARAAGLAYTDTEIEPGIVYAYKVETKAAPLLKALKVVRPLPFAPQPVIFSVEESDTLITIRWERELHERKFSAYYIERTPAGVDAWQRLNEQPYVQGFDRRIFRELPRFFAYNDADPLPGPAQYRLIGVDPFGDLSPPSPVKDAQTRDRRPPPAPLLTSDEESLTHLTKTLSWEQPAGEAVVAYHLERRHGRQKEVAQNWASPGASSKVDTVAESGIYAYRLIAEDAAGNLAYSTAVYAQLRDRIPPDPPLGLVAETDTTGAVTLTWDAATEEDVYGYYVYAADGDRRAYKRLTPNMYRSRRFVDTVSTALLNTRRLYYVVAIDNDRLYSAPSDTLELIPPDVNPPSPALIGDFRVEAEGIRLLLVHSSSRDVAEHRLLRRKLEEEEFMVLSAWEVPPMVFVDQNAEAGQAYLYAYQAIDHNGLESAIVTEIQAAMPPPPPPIPELEIESRDFRVFLSWEALDADHYLLYRSVDDGPKQRLQTLDGGAINYADARTEAGKTYTYQLRLVNAQGRKSAYSEPVRIQF